VYESATENLTVEPVRSGVAHWPQNLFSGGFAAPQDGQVAASGAAHSPQNFMPGGFSCWHRGHCMPQTSQRIRAGNGRTGGASLVWQAEGVNRDQ
jgi:hypothetical protein